MDLDTLWWKERSGPLSEARLRLLGRSLVDVVPPREWRQELSDPKRRTAIAQVLGPIMTAGLGTGAAPVLIDEGVERMSGNGAWLAYDRSLWVDGALLKGDSPVPLVRAMLRELHMSRGEEPEAADRLAGRSVDAYEDLAAQGGPRTRRWGYRTDHPTEDELDALGKRIAQLRPAEPQTDAQSLAYIQVANAAVWTAYGIRPTPVRVDPQRNDWLVSQTSTEGRVTAAEVFLGSGALPRGAASFDVALHQLIEAAEWVHTGTFRGAGVANSEQSFRTIRPFADRVVKSWWKHVGERELGSGAEEPPSPEPVGL